MLVMTINGMLFKKTTVTISKENKTKEVVVCLILTRTKMPKGLNKKPTSQIKVKLKITTLVNNLKLMLLQIITIMTTGVMMMDKLGHDSPCIRKVNKRTN